MGHLTAKDMDTLDKNSKPYKCKEYDDFFEAADTSSFVAEEAVAYSQSLQRFKATEERVEYASKISYNRGIREGMEAGINKGMEKGIEEERAKSIRFMRSLGISPERIAREYNITIDKVNNI